MPINFTDLVSAYNKAWHSAIRMAPTDVTDDTFKQAWWNLYGKKWPGYQHGKTNVRFNYNIGDNVRVSRVRGVFDKGYRPGFTEEIFTVIQRIPRTPPVYKLAGDDDEPIDAVFYEPEMVRVIPKQNGSKSFN